MDENTTGKPVSADAPTHTPTHTHTHTQRDGALLEAHGPSTKQGQSLEFVGKQEK